MELAQFTLCPFSFVSLESFSKDRALSPPSTVQKLSLLHLIYNNLLEQYLCITYKIKLLEICEQCSSAQHMVWNKKKILLPTSCRTSVGKYTKPSALSSEAIIILNKQAMFISTAKDVPQKEIHQPLKLMSL